MSGAPGGPRALYTPLVQRQRPSFVAERSRAADDLSDQLGFKWNELSLDQHDDVIFAHLCELTVDEFQYLLPGIIRSSIETGIFESGTIGGIALLFSGSMGDPAMHPIGPCFAGLEGYTPEQISAVAAWFAWIDQEILAVEQDLYPGFVSSVRVAFANLCALRDRSSGICSE